MTRTPFRNVAKALPLLLASNAFVLWTTPAWAYVDPGTGGMIISAIIGGIAAAAVSVKMYWYRLKSKFSGKRSVTDDSRDAGADR